MPSRRLAIASVLVASAAAAGVIYALKTRPVEPVPAVPEIVRGPAQPTGVSAEQPYPYGRVLVIAVGINQYPKLTGAKEDLRYAAADAEAMADLVHTQFGYEAQRLVGTAATKREIELAVKRAAEELGPDDALIFFFAGHGQVIELPGAGEAGFLVPQDAALDMTATGRHAVWHEQAINVHELFATASGSKARHVLFVLDACKSGIATGRGALAERADLKSFVFDKSRAVLTAVRRDQIAREDERRKHGLFTAELLDRLTSPEPASALDVYQHVLARVANRSNSSMLPQFGQIEGSGMMVFIPKAIPRADVERDFQNVPRGPLAGVQTRVAKAKSQLTTMEHVLEAVGTSNYSAAPDAENRAKEWEAKFERFRRNAGLGDGNAMAALCVCYAEGLGTARNPDLVYEFARQLDRGAQPPGAGKYFLGRCFEHGYKVAKNLPAAERLYRESADAKFILGELAVAELALKRTPHTEAAVAQIRKTFERGVDQKIAAAALDLATLYASGTFPGVEQNDNRAVELYERAAEWKSPAGMVRLYEWYGEDRPGRPRNVAKAEAYLRRAVALGWPRAVHLLAREYNPHAPGRRLNFPASGPESFKWQALAAGADFAPAQATLARLYLNGFGTEKNVEAAKTWCERAAAQNDPDAICLQGHWYLSGEVYGQKDSVKAAERYRRAADLNQPQACKILATLLRDHGDKFGKDNPHWLDILHYNSQAAKFGAISTNEAMDRLLDAYLKYVLPSDPEKRWLLFWRTHPESARLATKILKENTKRLDWFSPEKVEAAEPKP